MLYSFYIILSVCVMSACCLGLLWLYMMRCLCVGLSFVSFKPCFTHIKRVFCILFTLFTCGHKKKTPAAAFLQWLEFFSYCLVVGVFYFTTILRPFTIYMPGVRRGAASFTVVLRKSTTPLIEQIVTRVSVSANTASSPLTGVVVPCILTS